MGLRAAYGHISFRPTLTLQAWAHRSGGGSRDGKKTCSPLVSESMEGAFLDSILLWARCILSPGCLCWWIGLWVVLPLLEGAETASSLLPAQLLERWACPLSS